MGGLSSEREVSLNTGKGVLKALLERGRDAVGIDWTKGSDLTALLRAEKVETVWNALHGTWGEDGCVQGLLECLNIPYTGSGVLASALAMDKVSSKRIFERMKIPTPEWDLVGAETPKGFDYPLVIKPSREGSTVGVTIVQEPSQLAPAIELARACKGVPMIERYIAGKEASVGLLDNEVLGTVEIRPRRAFYDYAAKYQSGDTEYLVPPQLSADCVAATEAACRDAYLALGCRGHARVDVRIDEQNRPWVLEVNTLPGMTGTSLIPKIARHRGMDYATLVERILLSAGLRE
jgi:D-alanine-D-alanine ligase